MSAPEGPCQGAQGQLSTIGTRYSKKAPMRCFSPFSLSLGPGCSAISLCIIPFARPYQVIPLPRLASMVVELLDAAASAPPSFAK
jgi:hypothetical protein